MFTIFVGFSFAQLPAEYYEFRDYMYNFSKNPEEMENMVGEYRKGYDYGMEKAMKGK